MTPPVPTNNSPQMRDADAQQRGEGAFVRTLEKRKRMSGEEHRFDCQFCIMDRLTLPMGNWLMGAVPHRIIMVGLGGAAVKMIGIAAHIVSASVAHMPFGIMAVMKNECEPVSGNGRAPKFSRGHHRVIHASRWTGFYQPMPLPTLRYIRCFFNSHPEPFGGCCHDAFSSFFRRSLRRLAQFFNVSFWHGALLLNRTSSVNQ